jgi:HD-like signal output (HDOD) protein
MSIDADEKLSKDLLKGFVIPPRPQIVADIQIESAMPDPDINVISSIIAKDAGISGSLIKAVNSPLFGLSGTIKSVNHAVSLMGMNSVISIVTALSLKNVLSDEKVTGLNKFWDTASDVANAAVIVSKYLGVGSSDEVYSLGLFHDCGIPLMLMKYPDYLEVLEQGYQDSDQRVIDAENTKYKTDHSVLGFYTAKTWKLAEEISDVISYHHCVEKIFARDRKNRTHKKDLLLVLKISEHISGSFRTLGSCSIDHEWERIKDDILDYGGLVEDDILNMSDECKEAGIGLF